MCRFTVYIMRTLHAGVFLLLIPVLLFSQSTIFLSMPDTTALAGDTIIMPVMVDSQLYAADSIVSFHITISCDIGILSPVSLVGNGGLLDTSRISSNLAVNPLILAFAASGSESDPPLSGKGKLISVKYYVNLNAQIGGVYSLTFSYVTFNGQDYTLSSTGGKVTITGVIPVELSHFNACVSGDAVVLTWQTLSETNNLGFEILRSKDGINYTSAGFVEGNGTTDVMHAYRWDDKAAECGSKYFYWLRQIDFDGSFQITDMGSVEIPVPSGYLLHQNFPNPFNHQTSFHFQLPFRSHVNIAIYDMTGRLVAVLVDENKQPGVYPVVWNGRNETGFSVSSGTYFCRFTALKDGKIAYRSVKKITLLK